MDENQKIPGSTPGLGNRQKLKMELMTRLFNIFLNTLLLTFQIKFIIHDKICQVIIYFPALT